MTAVIPEAGNSKEKTEEGILTKHHSQWREANMTAAHPKCLSIH
jgi:hypothetical protein